MNKHVCVVKLGGANTRVFVRTSVSVMHLCSSCFFTQDSCPAVSLRTCILLSKLNLRCVSRLKENCCDHGPGFSDVA